MGPKCGPGDQLSNPKVSSKSGQWRPDWWQKSVLEKSRFAPVTLTPFANPWPAPQAQKNIQTQRIFQDLLEKVFGPFRPRVFKRGQCHGGKAGSFQNGFLPPIGPPLAGFGRYFGVRKLVPGATFWAHSRPPGGPKTARKIPKTSWEFPCALTPFALPPFANSWNLMISAGRLGGDVGGCSAAGAARR